MKKGLLLVTGALVLAGAVSCGGDKKPPKPEEPKVDPEVLRIIDGFKNNTLNSTLKVNYSADYELEVKPDNSFQNYERVVKDTVSIVADFTDGNPYLHIKRVGSEKAGEAASTYEALVLKDGTTYKYVTSHMADFATLASEDVAFAKIADLISRVSTRNGGGLTTKSFVYDGMYTYEHREFVLGAKGYKLEDMDDPITYTITADKGLGIKTKMNYVGWKTDAGYSELNNKPKEAANIEMNVTKDGYVTKMKETYNDAQLLMNITNPPAQLKLTGSRGFDAKYGEALTDAEKVTTINHEAKPVKVKVKPFYNGGTVKVYTSKAGDIAHKAEYGPRSVVNVGDWVIIEAKSVEGQSSGIKSVSLDENSITVIPVENNLYVFEATLEGENKVNVVFENAKAAKATIKLADGLTTRLNEFFTSSSFAQFELVNFQPQNLAEMLEGDAEGTYEVELSSDTETWGAVAVPDDAFKNGKTWEGFDVTVKAGNDFVNVMHFAPNPEADMPDHYFAFALKLPGEYTVDVKIKEGITIIPTKAAYPGFNPTIYFATSEQLANPEELGTARFMQTFNKATLLKENSAVFVEFNESYAEKVTAVKLGTIEPTKITIAEFHTIQYKFDLTGLTKGDVHRLEITFTPAEDADLENAVFELNDRNGLIKSMQYIVVNTSTGKQTPVTDNKVKAEKGVSILMVFTPNDNKEVKAFVVNGQIVTKGRFGYTFEIPDAGTYKIMPLDRL